MNQERDGTAFKAGTTLALTMKINVRPADDEIPGKYAYIGDP